MENPLFENCVLTKTSRYRKHVKQINKKEYGRNRPVGNKFYKFINVVIIINKKYNNYPYHYLLLAYHIVLMMNVQTVFQFGGGREFVNEERAKVLYKCNFFKFC